MAFATSIQLFLGWVRNCATHLDSASLHLGRGFRHMYKKGEALSGMQAFLAGFSLLVRVAQLLHAKKPPSPQLQGLQKQRFPTARSGVRTLDTLIKSQVLKVPSKLENASLSKLV